MREVLRNQGVDASILESDGAMIIVSDLLKLKPDRDELMRHAFDRTYRKALCTSGFKTVQLKSGVILGDGDEYSLGCPETKEERMARLQAEQSERQDFVTSLQRDFNSDSEGAAGMRVEQQGDELILTGSSENGEVPPSVLRALVTSGIDEGTKAKLCSVGFRGARARSYPHSSGVYVSFECRNDANR